MTINSESIHGHDLLAVERFKDATRHMIISPMPMMPKTAIYLNKSHRICGWFYLRSHLRFSPIATWII